MKQIWKPLSLILVLGVLLASLHFQSSSSDDPGTNRSLENLNIGINRGQLAPDFTGTTVDGEIIRLSDFRGKIVLINDFASWCGPCLIETPHLVELHNSEKGEVIVIGLNLEETVKSVVRYRDEFQVSYPLVMNQDGKLTEIYRPLGLPTSWFIDPDGIIRYVHTGPMTAPMLQEALSGVREGRQPDVFSVLN